MQPLPDSILWTCSSGWSCWRRAQMVMRWLNRGTIGVMTRISVESTDLGITLRVLKIAVASPSENARGLARRLSGLRRFESRPPASVVSG
jgi:hypothetical protein